MSVIKVDCTDQTLTITEVPSIDLEGTNSIQFSFCPKWDGYTKSVVFYLAPSQSYVETVVDDVVSIPSQVLSEGGCFSFVVKGTKSGTGDRESQLFRCRVESSGLIAEDPAESVHGILYKKISDAEDWIDGIDFITAADIDEMMGG